MVLLLSSEGMQLTYGTASIRVRHRPRRLQWGQRGRCLLLRSDGARSGPRDRRARAGTFPLRVSPIPGRPAQMHGEHFAMVELLTALATVFPHVELAQP